MVKISSRDALTPCFVALALREERTGSAGARPATCSRCRFLQKYWCEMRTQCCPWMGYDAVYSSGLTTAPVDIDGQLMAEGEMPESSIPLRVKGLDP